MYGIKGINSYDHMIIYADSEEEAVKKFERIFEDTAIHIIKLL